MMFSFATTRVSTYLRTYILVKYEFNEELLQAAATSCYVATDPRLENVNGKYFSDCNEASTSKLGSSSAEAARLWAASEDMVSKYIEK